MIADPKTLTHDCERGTPMILHDMIENYIPAPRLGSRLRINNNARNPDNRGLTGCIREYEIHVTLDDGNIVRVTAASVEDDTR